MNSSHNFEPLRLYIHLQVQSRIYLHRYICVDIHYIRSMGIRYTSWSHLPSKSPVLYVLSKYPSRENGMELYKSNNMYFSNEIGDGGCSCSAHDSGTHRCNLDGEDLGGDSNYGVRADALCSCVERQFVVEG